MAEDSDLERTEEATPKRLEKAREVGTGCTFSRTYHIYLIDAAAAGILFMGAGLMDKLMRIMKAGMQMERDLAFQTDLILNRAGCCPGSDCYRDSHPDGRRPTIRGMSNV